MISVRLSEEEYSALRRLCLVTGARSVSDLARDAMRALMNGANRENAFTNHMEEFRTEIRHLHKKIEHLAETVEAAKAQGA
jgi:hypothetical protein